MKLPLPSEVATALEPIGDPSEASQFVALSVDTYRGLRSKAMTADEVARYLGYDAYETSDIIGDLEALEDANEVPERYERLWEAMQDWPTHISFRLHPDARIIVPENFDGKPVQVVLSDELVELLGTEEDK